jgi:hypothetical protein
MLKLKNCGCDPGELIRLKRPFWLRALTERRLYRCTACGATSLVDRSVIYQHADSKWNVAQQSLGREKAADPD